jgi:IS605 OrfB family transposase
MIRTVKLSLKFATAAKRRQVAAVLSRQQACINRYIQAIWEHGGKLDGATFDMVQDARLSCRYRARAVHQALGIIAATRAGERATGQKSRCPQFAGVCQLSQQVAKIQKSGPGNFSYWLNFSTLTSYRPILLPVKGTKVLDKWLSKPGAVLRPSVGMRDGFVYFYVELPNLPPKTEGKDLGVDVGLKKMLVDSTGKRYGTDFQKHCQRVARRVKGSKSRRRAIIARDNYINETVNKLPWATTKTLVVENLKNLKRGKRACRSKSFRKAMAPWRYAQVLDRIRLKAAEHRVLVVPVCPSYTSQTCPSCKHRAKANRERESFVCRRCGFAADADHVGAVNILARFGGEPKVPRAERVPARAEA